MNHNVVSLLDGLEQVGGLGRLMVLYLVCMCVVCVCVYNINLSSVLHVHACISMCVQVFPCMCIHSNPRHHTYTVYAHAWKT